MRDDLTKDEARRELAEWEGFTRHPAWALLLEELQTRADRSLAALTRGGLDLEGYARHAATLDTITRLSTIPDERVQHLTSLLPTEDIE